MSMFRMFRQTCTVCSSSAIEWGSVGDRIADLEAEHGDWERINEWLDDLAGGVGVQVGPALLALDSWKCSACGEYGVFGPVEVGQ